MQLFSKVYYVLCGEGDVLKCVVLALKKKWDEKVVPTVSVSMMGESRD